LETFALLLRNLAVITQITVSSLSQSLELGQVPRLVVATRLAVLSLSPRLVPELQWTIQVWDQVAVLSLSHRLVPELQRTSLVWALAVVLCQYHESVYAPSLGFVCSSSVVFPVFWIGLSLSIQLRRLLVQLHLLPNDF